MSREDYSNLSNGCLGAGVVFLGGAGIITAHSQMGGADSHVIPLVIGGAVALVAARILAYLENRPTNTSPQPPSFTGPRVVITEDIPTDPNGPRIEVVEDYPQEPTTAERAGQMAANATAALRDFRNGFGTRPQPQTPTTEFAEETPQPVSYMPPPSYTSPVSFAPDPTPQPVQREREQRPPRPERPTRPQPRPTSNTDDDGTDPFGGLF